MLTVSADLMNRCNMQIKEIWLHIDSHPLRLTEGFKCLSMQLLFLWNLLIYYFTPLSKQWQKSQLYFLVIPMKIFRTIVAVHVMNKLFITLILLHTLSTCIHTETHIQFGCCAASIASQPIVCVCVCGFFLKTGKLIFASISLCNFILTSFLINSDIRRESIKSVASLLLQILCLWSFFLAANRKIFSALSGPSSSNE